MKTTPLPQDVILKYSDLPFHLILCSFVCLLGIFQKKLSYLKKLTKQKNIFKDHIDQMGNNWWGKQSRTQQRVLK